MTAIFSDASERPVETHDAAPRRKSPPFLWRRIWLPKLLYSALPFFYIAAGIAALFATIYISAWFWVLPHYLLFSIACLHLGILIFSRRHRRKEP